MTNRTTAIPRVDLAIVIDTSPSMKDEAQALSTAAEAAIKAASSSCPSDLRVLWLGIEGTWKNTKFQQTVRAYLTQQCKISESSLRGRKRRELNVPPELLRAAASSKLKSAGAQEDAARSIEDISKYLDWREGAKRAIFYLGDEALEGGGSKVGKKDREAADLAIQKANAARVTVHTYFGTSKSKHQAGIAAEYARVAEQTGGKAFAQQDTLKGFETVLEQVICGSRSAAVREPKPGTVYVQDCVAGGFSQLYTLNLETGKTTLVGRIATEIYDLAAVGSQLYGLHQKPETQLVKIAPATGEATAIGDIGFNVVGLAYNHQRDTLYASAANQLITIDLKTGKGSPAVAVSNGDRVCGEVAFDPQGRAYITLIDADTKKQLASCNLDTGSVKLIGDINFPNLASMEFVGDVLYGVTGNFFNLGKDGQLIRIDTATGKGTLVTTTDPRGRWAGMTVYKGVEDTSTQESELVTGKEKGTQLFAKNLRADEPAIAVTPDTSIDANNTQTTKETMQLTIDTKANCYVINPERMNDLQQNVASKFTLDKGTYEIKINSGRYSYAGSETGDPSILLWIYGIDGTKFINKNTGFEVGATWTTLNGYGDRLQIEVEEKVVVCGLFFDVGNRDRSGSVELLISSSKPFFNPQTLTVDTQRNCYVLKENTLSSLKQDANVVELEPGNYRVKIREGNASYWSSEKKFQLEPWALMWIQSGKFIPKLTGIEVSETWCSLNGLKDEFILEVKTKTTLSGFFFDTYKEDNEGQIILAIEPVSATEIANRYKQLESQSTTNETVTETLTSSATRTKVGVAAGNGGEVSVSSGFSFRFDEAQMEQMWQQMAAKIETSVSVTDEQDEKKEAYYWDNLEKWILKGYQSQAKELAMQVARLEFMMKTITKQMEVSFNQNFQAWSGHFDQRLHELVDTRITTMVDEQVNIRVENQTQAIKNQVVQQLQSDIDQRIDAAVNLKITNQAQEIKNQVVQQMQTDLDRRVDTVVNLKIDNQAQEINTQVVGQLQSDIDQRIDAAVSLKIADQAQNIKNLVVQQMHSDVERRINSAVNHSTDNNVQVVINNVMSNLDDRISVNLDNKIVNFRSDLSSIVRNEINENYTESLKTTVLSDIKKQQFFLDMQSIKAEVENFYNRLGQFETQLNLRIERGDTQLYNWTLEQLVALQGCISDRQALVEMFESFAANLKTGLDNAPCVNPSRFTPMDASLMQPELPSAQPQQLPGS